MSETSQIKLNLSSRDAVLSAIAEFDHLGRQQVLGELGFQRSKDYFVVHNGKYYDSKPLYAAAISHEYEVSPPSPEEFSGGIKALRSTFEKLGFELKNVHLEWIVLVNNEINADDSFKYLDSVGREYHFPNKYKNKIVKGTPFLYYKGTRRSDGTKGTPEYFGMGTIGEVRESPLTSHLKDIAAKDRQWVASIQNFIPFQSPVPFHVDGKFLEIGLSDLPRINYWGNGVRTIFAENAQSIIKLARIEEALLERNGFYSLLERHPKRGDSNKPPATSIESPDPKTIEGQKKIQSLEDFVKFTIQENHSQRNDSKAVKKLANRRSKRSTEIGDRGEKYFLEDLRSSYKTLEEKNKVVWVSKEGDTPGYDIRDENHSPPRNYEVKSTTMSHFSSFEWTINEFLSAHALRENYYLVLVVNVEKECVNHYVIQNPIAMIERGEMNGSPILLRMEFIAQS